MQQINLPNHYRAIFISDLHGNLKGTKNLLKKIEYKENEDYLFILGDIIEKGQESLKTLQFVMKLNKSPKCHVVIGNCDYLLSYLESQARGLKKYLENRKESVFWDMARSLNIDPLIHFNDFLRNAKERYKEEIKFVLNLPHVIESPDFLLAHAGLYANDNYLKTDLNYATSYDNQSLVTYCYPKPLIVGHWATVLYENKFILKPHFNNQNNVISIDGANSIKSYGQLNSLICHKQNNKLTFDYQYLDHLSYYTVKTKQEGTIGEKIVWPYNKIIDVKFDGQYIEGKLDRYGNRGYKEDEYHPLPVRILKSFVSEYNNEYYAKEFGNYFLDLPKGSKVGLINKSHDEIWIVKYQSEVGLVRKEFLEHKIKS